MSAVTATNEKNIKILVKEIVDDISLWSEIPRKQIEQEAKNSIVTALEKEKIALNKMISGLSPTEKLLFGGKTPMKRLIQPQGGEDTGLWLYPAEEQQKLVEKLKSLIVKKPGSRRDVLNIAKGAKLFVEWAGNSNVLRRFDNPSARPSYDGAAFTDPMAWAEQLYNHLPGDKNTPFEGDMNQIIVKAFNVRGGEYSNLQSSKTNFDHFFIDILTKMNRRPIFVKQWVRVQLLEHKEYRDSLFWPLMAIAIVGGIILAPEEAPLALIIFIDWVLERSLETLFGGSLDWRLADIDSSSILEELDKNIKILESKFNKGALKEINDFDFKSVADPVNELSGLAEMLLNSIGPDTIRISPAYRPGLKKTLYGSRSFPESFLIRANAIYDKYKEVFDFYGEQKGKIKTSMNRATQHWLASVEKGTKKLTNIMINILKKAAKDPRWVHGLGGGPGVSGMPISQDKSPKMQEAMSSNLEEINKAMSAFFSGSSLIDHEIERYVMIFNRMFKNDEKKPESPPILILQKKIKKEANDVWFGLRHSIDGFIKIAMKTQNATTFWKLPPDRADNLDFVMRKGWLGFSRLNLRGISGFSGERALLTVGFLRTSKNPLPISYFSSRTAFGQRRALLGAIKYGTIGRVGREVRYPNHLSLGIWGALENEFGVEVQKAEDMLQLENWEVSPSSYKLFVKNYSYLYGELAKAMETCYNGDIAKNDQSLNHLETLFANVSAWHDVD